MTLAACTAHFSTKNAVAVQTPQLQALLKMDPLDHVVYVGSDGTSHYFHHSQLFGGGSYKIARTNLRMPNERQLATNTSEETIVLSGKFELGADGIYLYAPYLPPSALGN
jgi:hypothetical protein